MLLGLGHRGRTINQLQIGRRLFAQFPGHVVQRRPHQMDDAELHLGPRIGSWRKLGVDSQSALGEGSARRILPPIRTWKYKEIHVK